MMCKKSPNDVKYIFEIKLIQFIIPQVTPNRRPASPGIVLNLPGGIPLDWIDPRDRGDR